MIENNDKQKKTLIRLYSAVFPTPPAVTQQAMALSTEMDSMGVGGHH